MSKNNKDVKRGIVLYIDGKEVKRDVTDIKAEIRKLTKELDRMTIGSKEYNAQMAKIRHLNSIVRDHKGRLREVNEELGKSHFNAGKLVDGFNRFGGVVLAAIGFLTGFALALRSIREERNKLESSQAGLKALTGLDDSSIAWLTEQAKTLSTTMTEEGLRVRQSAAEILDAFMLVGSAKPELLGDKEALKQVTEEAMRLQAAAKDITLNEAVDALTLSLNQYGAQADQAARYANVLAAGSKEGAANIASQAKAIRTAGTAAASANISIEQTVGLVETLAYRGIKDEVAGTGLKRFFLKLQTGVDETNPKIVGLDKALENLKNKNMDAGGIKKMFGEEGFNAASVILQNTDMVNNFTKAVTGTNVAYEQAAINSATAAAKLDQARNKMKLAAIELGEKLNPAFTVSTNMMTNVIKILPGLIDWFQKWIGTIVALLVPVAAYVGYLKLINAYLAISNTLTVAARIISLKFTIAKYSEIGAYSKVAAATKLYNAEMAKNNVLVTMGIRISNTLKAVLYSLQIAYYTLTLQMGKARGAMVAFNMVSKMNPYVLLLSVITAISAAIYLFTRRINVSVKAQKDLNEINKKVGEGIAEEKAKIDLLLASIHNSNGENTKRIEAINELKKIIPEYNAEISKEGTIINENTEAIKDYLIQLERQMKMSAVSEKMRELYRKQFEQREKVNVRKVEVDNLETEYANQSDTSPDYGGYRAMGRSSNLGAVRSELEKEERELKDIDFRIDSLKTLYGSLIESPAITGEVRTVEMVTKELNNAKAVLEELKNTNIEYFNSGELISYNARLKQAGATVTKLTWEVKKLKKAQGKTDDGNGSGGDGDDEKDDKDKFVKVEEDYYRRISAIKKKYLDDDTMTQEQYSEQMQQAEMQLLNDKLTVARLEPKECQQIADQILDIEIKMKEKRLAIGLTETKEILSTQEKRLQLELESTAKDYKKHLISREEFLRKIKELQEKYGKNMPEPLKVVTEAQQKELEKYLDKLQEVIDKYKEMEEEPKKWNDTVQKNWEEINKYTNASSDEMTAILASLIIDLGNLKIEGTETFGSLEDSGEAMFTLLGSLGKQFGVEIGEMLSGEEEAVGEFLKNTLNMVLTAIEQLMIAYIAQTTMRNIAEMGVWGLLKAAGEIALITAAFESVKGLVGNFYTGGYTSSGEWDQPQGIVHSNEFVANRYAVANPAVRPVLDLIDGAQRTGSIANLTAQDIASVVGGSSATKATPAAQIVQVGSGHSDVEMTRTMQELNSVITKLVGRLNDPFYTLNVISGRSGLKNKLDEYETLLNNKSRKS